MVTTAGSFSSTVCRPPSISRVTLTADLHVVINNLLYRDQDFQGKALLFQKSRHLSIAVTFIPLLLIAATLGQANTRVHNHLSVLLKSFHRHYENCPFYVV